MGEFLSLILRYNLFFTFRSSSTTTKPLHYRFLEDLKKWPLFPGPRLKDAPLSPVVASDLQGVPLISGIFQAGTFSGLDSKSCFFMCAGNNYLGNFVAFGIFHVRFLPLGVKKSRIKGSRQENRLEKSN